MRNPARKLVTRMMIAPLLKAGALSLGLLSAPSAVAADLSVAITQAAADAPSATPSVILPGVSSGPAVWSYLRFFNGDSTAQTATVHLRDPESGLTVFAWTTPSISPGGTFEAAVADMIAAATQGAIPNSLPPTLVAEVTGAFMGRVQHVALAANTSTLSHVSACGMSLMADPLSLPYVSGPGRADVIGLLRVTNGTTTSANVRLTFRDNAGLSSIWTSPPIAPMGSYVRAANDIASEATPPVSAQAKSWSVVADAAPMGVTLSYSEGLLGVPGLDDFSAGCVLTSATPATPAPSANGNANSGAMFVPPTLTGNGMTCADTRHLMPMGDGTMMCMM